MHPNVRRRLTQTGEWIVHFYEVTGEPEKALAWREKFAPPKPRGQ